VNTPNFDAGTFGPPRDGAVSARDMIRLISDHVWTVLGVALVIVALAAFYVALATPVYTAGALVRIESPDPNELGMGSSGGPLVVQAQAPSTDAEVAMMQSREVLEPVMKRFGYDLTVKTRTLPLLGLIASKFATPGQPSRAWFGMQSYGWGGEEIHIDSLKVPPALENAKLRLRALDNGRYDLLDTDGSTLLSGQVGQLATGQDVSMLVTHLVARPHTEFQVVPLNTVNALKRFSRDLKVMEKGKETGIVQIAFDSSNPVVAAGVANAVADGYVANTIENRRRSDSKTLDFINQELPRLRDELKQSEGALSSFQSSSNSLQPTAEAQSYLQGGIDLQRQIASLQLQRTQLLLHFQPTSAPVQNIDQQLAQLNDTKSTFDARFNKMPASQRKDVDLTRNAKVAESIYVTMMNKAEELTVRRAGNTGDVHMVDAAVRPADPVSPNIPVVLGGSAGLGLMLGALFVFARSQLLTGVSDPRFVEWSLSIPVLGSVLYSPEQAQLKRAMLHTLRGIDSSYGSAASIPLLPATRIRDGSIVKGAGGALPPNAHYLLSRSFPHNASVEALRGVRTAMHFAGGNASEDKIVVLTGPTPGTGKSFVAANLAVLEAETTKRVLLIDADMRCGHLAQAFGQANSRGLAELLMGDITSDQAIREVGVPGLAFISCGAYPANPSELLMMPRFQALLDVFNKRFDLVIVDTPPLLAVSDASIIANRAGSTVLILRSGMQTEEEIEETVTKLRRAGASLGGAVFNAVPLRRSERRAYGHMTAYSNHNHAAA
jgi:tyrosine-protein kinase Etk/Wzc